MPRAPRLDFPGALHHVIVRGIERRKIFRSDRDRKLFLDRLASLVVQSRAALYAWALMPNHAHALLRTGNFPLSRLVQSWLAPYVGTFNRIHRRAGHLFQNRFKSILVEVVLLHAAPHDLDRHPRRHLAAGSPPDPVRHYQQTELRQDRVAVLIPLPDAPHVRPARRLQPHAAHGPTTSAASFTLGPGLSTTTLCGAGPLVPKGQLTVVPSGKCPASFAP
jgi:REP element-mobilizing transposase RayT